MSERKGAGTDLVPAPGPLVHPESGELIDVREAQTSTLGEFLNALREHEDRVKDAKRVATDEVLRRMDGEAQWTVEVDGWKLTAPSPDRTAYDVDVLRRELAGLRRQGKISKAALGRAIKRETKYTVVVAGVNALRRLGGEVAEAIERSKRKNESPRYVRTTPPKPRGRG